MLRILRVLNTELLERLVSMIRQESGSLDLKLFPYEDPTVRQVILRFHWVHIPGRIQLKRYQGQPPVKCHFAW